MNGMNCGTVSTTAWEVLKHGVDVSVTVRDLEVHRDLQYLHSQSVKNGALWCCSFECSQETVRREKARTGFE